MFTDNKVLVCAALSKKTPLILHAPGSWGALVVGSHANLPPSYPAEALQSLPAWMKAPAAEVPLRPGIAAARPPRWGV